MWRKFVKLGFLMLAVMVTGCSLRTAKESTEIQTSMESEDTIQAKESTPPLELNNAEMNRNQKWPFSNYDDHSWLPNGEYYACFFDTGVDLYNTDNEWVRHFELPNNISYRDYYPVICNDYFFLYPNEKYEDEFGHHIIWKDSRDQYRFSDMLQIDWYGNIIREHPKVERITDESGKKKYYLYGQQVTPVKGSMRWSACTKRLDDDWILFIPYKSVVNVEYFYYIPSENSLNAMGMHDSSHQAVKTPIGMIWIDNTKLYLTTRESTELMFNGREVHYFSASDEIMIVAFEDEFDISNIDGTPIYYASLEDLELHEIDRVRTSFAKRYIDVWEHYVIYADYEDTQKGYHVLDTNTGELWVADMGDESEGSASLASIRQVNGEIEITVDHNEGYNRCHKQGFYVISKNKQKYYPRPWSDLHDYYSEPNPQYTFYIKLSADMSFFSIKPLFKSEG